MTVFHQLKLHLTCKHIKRAVYQEGHVWAQIFSAIPTLPSPSEWGWQMQAVKEVKWTTLPEASQACGELL